GDGGQGGDIVLEVSPHTDNLRDFYYRPHLKAKNGLPGSGQQRTGRAGKSLLLKVPPGTVIYKSTERVEDQVKYDEDGLPIEDYERPEPELNQIADLTRDGDRFVLAHGGKGGKGNMNFKTSTNQAPTEATPGTAGEEGYYYLELRRIADGGFVGFPNAGKSTLLRKLSAARPKVAAYPFTTLNPMVGVIDFPGYQRATLADIPGLIEGAHANVGLGHAFLRHTMRCRVLIFVVDIAGSEERNPIEDVEKLRKEIRLYDESLAQRPWFVIANKMDLESAEENLTFFKNRFPKVKIIPVSAKKEEGLNAILDHLQEQLLPEKKA
ncbi:MAG: GTPase ObgE, partial [Verrucomicrobiota bacterium]